MIASLTPYPAMKDSGVEWLGMVPEHWEIRRVKSLSVVKRGASPRPIGDVRYFENDGEYAWVRIADVTASDQYLERTTQRLSPLGQSLSVRLQPGSLFLSIAGSVGKPIITKIKCCIHDGFVYFPDFKGNPEFLFHLFSCRGPFARLGKLGTQLNLNTDTVGRIYLAWPPESVQTAIVRFLKHADRRIKRYIRAKQELIALLEEQRRHTTQVAVQSSDVPHYRLKQLVNVVRRPVKRMRDQTYTPIGLYNRGRGIFRKDPRRGDELGDSDFFWVADGDLVLSGQFAWEGAIAIVRQRESGCVASHRYPILRGKSDVMESGFLLAYLQTGWGHLLLDHYSRGAAGRNRPLNLRTLLKEKVPRPALPTQRHVAKMLKRETIARQQIKALTGLLLEYRARLVTDVITGKLDVREAALMLDEPEELDSLDEADVPAARKEAIDSFFVVEGAEE